MNPTDEQKDAARQLTEDAFSAYPEGRTMLVARWIAIRDAEVAAKAVALWREAVEKILRWATERKTRGISMDHIEVEASILLRNTPP